MRIKDTHFDSEDTVVLLQSIVEAHRGEKVAVFLDNATYHKSRVVSEYV